MPQPINKGTGVRWFTGNGQYGIRIDKGNPMSRHLSQRVDHVRVTCNGQPVWRDGKRMLKSDNLPKPADTYEAYIPLTEWIQWKGAYFPHGNNQ